MALRIPYRYGSGFAHGYSIELLGDETCFAFKPLASKASLTTYIAGFLEDAASLRGRYRLNFVPTSAAQVAGGDHLATIQEIAVSDLVVGELHMAMDSRDDEVRTPGGSLASVSTPVLVGWNADDDGYSLASTGLDAVPIENGINARQALSPILAASAGVLVGAGTGIMVITGGNVPVTRMIATTDNVRNCTLVSLSLPI
jgi:hypothetical protein